jgi:hypothetical protein
VDDIADIEFMASARLVHDDQPTVVIDIDRSSVQRVGS